MLMLIFVLSWKFKMLFFKKKKNKKLHIPWKSKFL